MISGVRWIGVGRGAWFPALGLVVLVSTSGCEDDDSSRSAGFAEGDDEASEGEGDDGDSRGLDGSPGNVAPSNSARGDAEAPAGDAAGAPVSVADAGLVVAPADGSASETGAPLSPEDVVPVVIEAVDAAAPQCSSLSGWTELRALPEGDGIVVDRLFSVSANGRSWWIGVRSAADAGAAPATVDGPEDAGREPDAGLTGEVSDASADEAAQPSPIAAAFDGPELYQTFVVDLPSPALRIELPSDYTANRGGALSPSGKRLVVVNRVPNLLAELRRDDLGDEFGAPESEPFLPLQNAALQTGYQYIDPAFSASGDSLYVGVRYRERFDIRQYRSDGERWHSVYLMTDLQGMLQNPADTILTSASADDRTVFLWDPVAGEALAAARDVFGQPTGEIVALGVRSPVFVDATCSRLFGLDRDGRLAQAERE